MRKPLAIIRNLTAAFVAVTALPALAQAQETEGYRSGAGYFMLGVRQVQASGTNQVLEQSGLGTLDQMAITIGGGGHFMFGRFIVGGEGQGIFASGGRAPGGRSTVRGGLGMVRVGLALVSTPRFNLYPLLGLGGGGLGLGVPNGATGDLAEGNVRKSTGGLLTEFGLGLDTRIPVFRDTNKQGFVLIGLRAGYTWAPLPGQWEIEAAGRKHELSVEGASLRLLVGFGGYALQAENP
jgi:hypothetical protein